MRGTLFAFALIGLVAGALGDYTCASPPPPCCKTFYDVISENNIYSTLKAAVDAAGLKETLMKADLAGTLLAPTNDAFAEIPADTLKAILADKDKLTAILLNHFIPDKVILSGEFMNNTCYDTLYKPVCASITCSCPTYKCGYWEECKPDWQSKVFFTPQGTEIKSELIYPMNLETCKGVVQTISKVLVPVFYSPPPPPCTTCTTLTKYICSTKTLSTLCSLLKATKLDVVLDDPTLEVTVFAPTDDAFNKYDLTKIAAADVPKILLNHVVPAKVLSKDVMNGACAETLDKKNICFKVTGNDIFVQPEYDGAPCAKVICPYDVELCKAVLHTIDDVLIPSDFNIHYRRKLIEAYVASAAGVSIIA